MKNTNRSFAFNFIFGFLAILAFGSGISLLAGSFQISPEHRMFGIIFLGFLFAFGGCFLIIYFIVQEIVKKHSAQKQEKEPEK